jgi:hypothetical protein
MMSQEMRTVITPTHAVPMAFMTPITPWIKRAKRPASIPWIDSWAENSSMMIPFEKNIGPGKFFLVSGSGK